jgi:hypothetical protein
MAISGNIEARKRFGAERSEAGANNQGLIVAVFGGGLPLLYTLNITKEVRPVLIELSNATTCLWVTKVIQRGL